MRSQKKRSTPMRWARLPFGRKPWLLAAAVAALPLAARADTFTVTADTDDGQGDVTGSLSWAIDQANAAPGSTIDFNFPIGGGTAVTIGGIEPMITAAVTINGGSGVTINGQGAYRVFFVNAPSSTSPNVTIENVHIANGLAQGGSGGAGGGGGGLGAGGGLFVGSGNVSLVGVRFTGSAATGGNGGAAVSGPLKTSAGGGGGLGGNGGDGNAASGSYAPGGGGGGGGLSDTGDGGRVGISGPGSGGNGGGYRGSGGGAGGSTTGVAGGNGSANGGGGGGGPAGAGGAGGTYGGGGGAGTSALVGGAGGFGGGGGGGAGSGGFGAGGGGGIGATGAAGGMFGGAGGAGPGVNNGFGGGGGGAALGAGVFVQQGASVSFTNSNIFGSSGNLIAGVGGSPDAGNGGTAGSAMFLMGGNTTFNVSGGQTSNIAGSIAESSPSSITVAGSSGGGTLVLGSDNSYSGGTTIINATLNIDDDGELGDPSGEVTIEGDGVLLSEGITTGRTFNLTGAGELAADVGASITYAGATVNGGFLAGSSHVFEDGTTLNGTTLLAGVNASQSGGTVAMNITTIRGTFTQTGGTLNYNDGLTTSSGSMNISGTLNTSGVESDGVLSVNPGGIVNNSNTDLTLGGGSRTFIGSVANPGGTVNLTGGTAIDLDGGLLVNNGVINGTTNVNFGGLAEGAGTYGAVNVNTGGTFHPGNSPGAVTTGSSSWGSGGTFEVDIDNAAGSAGTNYSQWNINGMLSITSGSTSNSQFTIAVDSLTAADSPGLVANFNPDQDYSFEILTTTAGISGFDPADIAIDTAGFSNPTDGTFSVSEVGNDLFLNYTTVPEPAMLGMVLSLATLLVRPRRRDASHG